ncbi:hypothetical protein NQ314_009515 [Rhamnusium bicolor]|uniref:Cytochrome P450 n=1 Tax=Rhamnusium bicolor TaxID=1586634 RepID=A0AAV8XZA1_9CUCU|nr:hypothetical protein NQ314_009515 [Rhamnusium bicolor]
MDLFSDVESLSMEEKVNIILKTVIKTSVDLNSLTDSVNELKVENKQLKTKINDLENKINTLEYQNKENYLIFYGIMEMDNETTNNLEEQILEIILEKVGVDDVSTEKIEKVYRMGTNTNKKRPVAVKFLNYKIKYLIYKNARNLKDSGYAISLYYSIKDQEDRKKLLPYLIKARTGKKVNDKIYLKRDMLVINKEMLTLEQCDGTTLTIPEIAAQCLIFFTAGFETSSTTMSFALYELATHQEMQEKVRKEINTVFAKHDNQMTYDSLSELKYMKQVIDETLRKYPPVPLTTRQCVKDYKVPDEDVIIEKGTIVMIPISGIHHDEDYYKNPEVFDPERFNEENIAQRPKYTHLPFGEGPRICIGERFGIMQTKVGLTCLLRNFRVKLNEKTQIPLKMSTKQFLSAAEGDIWLNIEKL